MTSEKRRGVKPIPDNLADVLNGDQLASLRQMERFGWELRFIRRPLFQERTIVVYSPDGDKIGVMEEDGRINMNADITIRD
ncbi:MAG TPA: hypothetical protein DCZ13_15205 [Porticoccaceae bacterium]|nr:hypothetical protein [Porticoccaceae bacterium]